MTENTVNATGTYMGTRPSPLCEAASENDLPPLAVRGVDISSLAEVEACGARFSDSGGVVRDMLEIAADAGTNLARVRIWEDPRDSCGYGYLGGGNDLATSLALASRANALGMDVMVDLHYSDFWTDPKKQQVPKGWSATTLLEVEDLVRGYTARVLGDFVDAGVAPSRVQIGNEVTNGMLWPWGRLPEYDDRLRRRPEVRDHSLPDAFDALAGLLRAGCEEARQVTPGARLSLHLDRGGDNHLYREWFDAITSRDVSYDEIGLSYYPYWHGSLDDLSANLTDLVTRYDKDVLVLETAYGYSPTGPEPAPTMFDETCARTGGFPATPEGQRGFLCALRRRLAQVPGSRGLGFVYWEPGWLAVPGTSWASDAGMVYGDDIAQAGPSWSNQALFDTTGRALPAWGAFAE